MPNQIFTKLNIKAGQKVLIVNSPAGYAKASADIDLKPAAKKLYDAVQVFVKNSTELKKVIGVVLKTTKEDGLLWMCYPKKTSSIKSDLSRDKGWDLLVKAGFEGVAMVSIDDTWSAFRFRKKVKSSRSKVKSSKQKAESSRPMENDDDLRKNKNAVTKNDEPRIFTAVLEKPNDGMDTAFINIPFDVEEVYGTNGMVKVKALFDGHPYRGSLSNMGTGCHIIIVRKDVREAIGKKVGDKVRVQIQRDTAERVIEMPADLLVALGDNAKARTFFDSLSFTNRKEYAAWIATAKRDETRLKRLRETIEKLLKGKKNPSEK